METLASWEGLLLGALLILLFFWWRPGLKASFQLSKHAESDWGAVLLPIGLVVLFVIFLIAMV
ncbi:MAG: hypothetical protein ACU84J_06925 [Gammaproteobacteria bacterium]